MVQETKLEAPPYVSFKTFQNFLDWLKEAGVPDRIDRSFWGDRLSGAYGSQLMAALRFLDLLDEDNHPVLDLERMAHDTDGQRRPLLREHLESSYATALQGLDLDRATAGQLQERFKQYPIDGDTLRKALVFFTHAAQYAGMPLSSHITKKTRGTGSGGAKRKPRNAKPKSNGAPPPPAATGNEMQAKVYGLHPSVDALLTDLTKISREWTKGERDAWLRTFQTVLDYAYPIKGGDSEG